jgi:hypothetical protein
VSYIVYDELLADELQQDFVSKKEQYVEGVHINIYKAMNPAGIFTVSIKDSSGNTLGEKSYTVEQMQALGSTELSDDYYHGFVYFEFDSLVFLSIGTYYITLDSSGYTYSDSENLGWLRDWEHKVVNNDTAEFSVNEPLSYRLYTIRR